MAIDPPTCLLPPRDVPLNLVQRWLGHADLADVMGAEEREIAARMW